MATASDGPISVLHVDDDESFLALTAASVGTLDRDIAIYGETDPTAALDRLDAGSFDCVVTDLRMPDRDGIDLMHSIHRRVGLPVIMFTGSATEAVEERAQEAGAKAVLQKRLGSGSYGLLARTIERVVQESPEATVA